MKTDRKILIFYDYFDPAFKAGGPIRSLVNLCGLIEGSLSVYVVSSNKDHDGAILNVTADAWQKHSRSIQVMYLSAKNQKRSTIKNIITEVNPDKVYLNGMFSLTFQVYPLWVLKKLQSVKIVLAPRGMLQKEPLSFKPVKKKIYLKIFSTLFLDLVDTWHVTTAQEKQELISFIGKGKNVVEIGNVPDFQRDVQLRTAMHKLRKTFGTIALISPMKNFHHTLEAMAQISTELHYKIYGPIKDQRYWAECLELIKKMPSNIHCTYEGEISPGEVGRVIRDLDFYIQPSKSENFGHSIFEAFNQGVPVITSDQTPWKSLQEKKAGWDVDMTTDGPLKDAIVSALAMNDETYLAYRNGARNIAVNYMQSQDFLASYTRLFA